MAYLTNGRQSNRALPWEREETNTLNPITNQLYNTISCPCDHSPIIENGKIVNCERDNFGIKTYVNPIVIWNHQIDSQAPKKGDKWECNSHSMKCEQNDFKWDTLHIIQVLENKAELSSSFLNSKASQSNCYIPNYDLDAFVKETFITQEMILEKVGPVFPGDININNPDRFIDGNPLFETIEQAQTYENYYNNGIHYSKYNDDGVTKYIPGHNYPDQKTITGCIVGKRDLLKYMVQSDWKGKSYSSTRNKIEVSAKGEVLPVIIKGDKPTYSMEIKDSSGCSILSEKIENYSQEEGRYKLLQKFPPLITGKASEVYTFKLTPSATTVFDIFAYQKGTDAVRTGIITGEIWQFRDPVFTLEAVNVLPTSAFTTSAITVTGKANSYSKNLSSTHTTTLTVHSGKLYIKDDVDLNIDNLVTVNNDITTVYNSSNDGLPECTYEFKVDHSLEDLEVGMTFSGEVETTKTVRKTIVIDDDACDTDVEILTNKFGLDNTTSLFPGMMVTGIDFFAELISIDDATSITLATKHIVTKNTDLTFSYASSGVIGEIAGKLIKTSNCLLLPNKAALTFKKNKSALGGIVSFDKNGSDTIVITSTIDEAFFGQDDKTFTLSTDKFITTKPNAHDSHIVVGKNTSCDIDFVSKDTDGNKLDKNIIITNPNLHVDTLEDKGSEVYISARYAYTPPTNFTGKDRIRFTVNDGTTLSDEKSIFITVK